jgi:hypothetical protein
VKTGRVELRVDIKVRAQLEDLAGDMRCSISEVVRRLVADEHGKRCPKLASVTPSSTTITSTAPITLEQAGPAAAMLIEMGMTPEELGIAV